ncbi:Hypothetical predicted protein [Octopus vulgaris]|uniref:Uncharacterized protein n=1 Tax=Octopus vulgaris TaxID=6645 RepID=A0AA36FKH1_OCTVU|nr:Hypothetical predicted protein [Octopus vulgaris]
MVEAKAAVTHECLELSRKSDCRFYDCLHARYPCGVKEVPENSSRAQCELEKSYANGLNDKIVEASLFDMESKL